MPQHVEFGGLREHTIDPAAVYEITLHGATARRPDRRVSVVNTSTNVRNVRARLPPPLVSRLEATPLITPLA